MSKEWDTVVDAYLSGELSAEQAHDFEIQLSRPEVAQALAEALMLRELLVKTPPEEIPKKLLKKITLAVEAQRVNEYKTAHSDPETKEPASGLRQALRGLGWLWRGPAYGLSAPAGSNQALRGFMTVVYSLGPLRTRYKKSKTKKTRLGLVGRLLRMRS